jgi:hypothetical protein
VARLIPAASVDEIRVKPEHDVALALVDLRRLELDGRELVCCYETLNGATDHGRA